MIIHRVDGLTGSGVYVHGPAKHPVDVCASAEVPDISPGPVPHMSHVKWINKLKLAYRCGFQS